MKKNPVITLQPSVIDGITWPVLLSPEANAVMSLAFQLEQTQWWTAKLLTALQLRQIESLLKHAWNTVPYYRQSLNDVVKLPTETLSMGEFRKLPLLRKTDVQAHKNDILSTGLPESHLPLHNISTSGSTGEPLTMVGSSVSALMNSALSVRWHTWHKRAPNTKFAEIVLPVTSAADDPSIMRRWGYKFATGPKVFMPANRPIKTQIEWLLHENPHYFITLPSNLNALLEHCEKFNIRIPNLREVMTRGEPLNDELRAFCRRIWDLPINSTYGAEEFAFVAMQCPDATHYHVLSEHVLLEVLDDAGNVAKLGHPGRVVITDLQNFAMPMIRYEIGDFAVRGPSCSCGRGLPVIKQFVGRTRNMFTLRSGDKFWPLYSKALVAIRDEVPSIRQAQLIQRSRHEVTIRAVVSQTLSPEDEATLKQGIAEALGGHFEIQVDYVESIPHTASGKFEEALSEVTEA